MNSADNRISERFARVLSHGTPELLQDGLKGLEKESLRITRDGLIAQTPHPAPLGSALTHPQITTDYSEALLEFITPPFADLDDSLDYLASIHRFVYQHLDRELLLAASIPCGIAEDERIPIADYGCSNSGRMKHIYRRGLWYRYGRAMQTIAGIHFNYSVPDRLWTLLYRLEKSPLSLTGFIADAYLGLIRNLQYRGWLILYLFGASPAVCKSFFKSRPFLMTDFAEFDNSTLFHPYATSLRMSDIGYKSASQAKLAIDYNSLPGYVLTLNRATNTPFPEYEKIGVKVNGEYRQLSSAILQIENEFYSTVRPKQITASGEKPSLALLRRGIRYIELRSLDLDLFCPIGIDVTTARFVEALMLTCLFQDSPYTTGKRRRINNTNQLTVALRGRQPGLLLETEQGKIPLKDWAVRIMVEMEPICDLLDDGSPERPYTEALERQRQAIQDPELTPSATILRRMTKQNQSYSSLALEVSVEHERYFRQQDPDHDRNREFHEMARVSHAKQQELEAADEESFDQFLHRYFSQH